MAKRKKSTMLSDMVRVKTLPIISKPKFTTINEVRVVKNTEQLKQVVLFCEPDDAENLSKLIDKRVRIVSTFEMVDEFGNVEHDYVHKSELKRKKNALVKRSF